MVDKDLQEDRIIARKIPRAWTAFFATFGRLTPVQRAAIPVLAEGHNALVISPTASGKTEAVCAPLVERHYGTRDPWTILYISPTRALVNDLYQRLFMPLERLSLSLKRRTGDHHDRLGRANVLLTTPESFDSLLCRGRTSGGGGHLLANVVALVLDEIHLLHGNARGEQVRWLIERLRRLRRQAKDEGWAPSEDFQTVALSATVPNPNAIVNCYLGQAEVIQVTGGRDIEIVPHAGPNADTDTALLSYIRKLTHAEKILVFANARRRADDLASLLRHPLGEFGYQVSVHHGSLARTEREATEESIRIADKIVVFSTSTLEIGIDIGDIDLVVLDGPAPDLRALLQRIGRGNRRTSKTRVMMCAGSFLEVVVHSAMLQAVRDDWLGLCEFGPEHAVARQQVASYIFQSPRRTRAKEGIKSLLDNCAPSSVTDTLIEEMVISEELIEDRSGLRLGSEWVERAASGQIHSNIESVPGVTIVDEESGRPLATGVRYTSTTGSTLGIGGNLLEARNWDRQKLEVRRLKVSGLVEGNWGYISRGWYKGADQPQAVKRYLGIPEDVWPVISYESQSYVFHFGGARRKAFLQLAAGSNNVNITEWYIAFSNTGGTKPDWACNPKIWSLDLAVAENLEALERTLNRPKGNQAIPLVARLEEVKQWLRLEEETQCLEEASWNENDEDELVTLLREIAKST